MIEMECPCCGERTKADAPQGVDAPVQYGPRVAALGTYLWHGQFMVPGQKARDLAPVLVISGGKLARRSWSACKISR
jgi:transposase